MKVAKEDKVPAPVTSRLASTADSLAFVWLLIGSIILPLIIVPWWSMPVSIVKQLTLPIIALGMLIFWLVSRIEHRSFVYPRHWAVVLLGLPLVATGFSVFFAPNIYTAWSGANYDIGTFVSFVMLFSIGGLAALLVGSKEKVLNVGLAILLAGLVTAVYQAIQFMFGAIDSLWIFTFPLTLIGAWYESGVFFGFIAILALIFIEFLSLREIKFFRIFFMTTLVLSLILVALVNFYYVWVAIGLVSIATFVYALVRPVGGETGKAQESLTAIGLLRPSFVVFLVSVMFLTLATPQGIITEKIAYLYTYLQIPFVEVRPGVEATWFIARGVLGERAIFGAGPNQFYTAWVNYKPEAINLTQFWNVDFNTGFGTLATWIINTGVVGFVAWLSFFIGLIYLAFLLGRRSYSQGDKLGHVMAMTAIIGSAYFWIFTLVYNTEAVSLFLAFLWSGIIVGLAVQTGVVPLATTADWLDRRKHVAVLVILIITLIVSVSATYLFVERAVGILSFYRAVRIVNVGGDIDKAEQWLSRAIKYNEKADAYYRTLSNVQFVRLANLLRDTTQSPEILQEQFRVILQATIANSNKAIEINPDNYLNYVSLGQIYESLVPLKVQGSYDQALAQYKKARELNPTNPSILFNIARLEMTGGNKTSARDYLSQSLGQKPNFASALLVLAQIEAQEGRLDDAIRRTEEAVASYPNDPGVFFQLGFYLYQDSQYSRAVEAFARVVALSPNNINANAQYFMGLAYQKLGDTTNALKQLEQVAAYNPDNAEVINLVRSLKNSGNESVKNGASTSKDKE